MNSTTNSGNSDFETMERAPPVAGPRPCELLVVGGRTEAALVDNAQALASWLERYPSVHPGDVAYSLVNEPEAFEIYTLVTAGSRTEAIERLRAVSGQTLTAEPAVERAVFLFSGQGTQEPHMAAGLYHGCGIYRSAFDDCARIARDVAGLDLAALIYGEPASAERLKETRFAQPALFAVEYALAQCWLHWGLRPAAVIGHSFGEYAAACIAGVMSLEDALDLVIRRARLLSDMPAGAMLSVRLDEESLRRILPADLDIAAVNSPSHCVVSGSGEAVARFAGELSGSDTPCSRLHTSQAFHSRMMTAALEPFSELISGVDLQPPGIPFIPTARSHTSEELTPAAPAYWVHQITDTVRFADAIREAAGCAPTLFLEVGPRRVLAQLAPLCVSGFSRSHRCAASLAGREDDPSGFQSMLHCAGTAWVSGLPFDWGRFFAGEERQRLSLPIRAEGTETAQTSAQAGPGAPSRAVGDDRETAPAARIRALLRETTGLDLSEADETTDFFELGLDSLSLTYLASQLSRRFNVTISFRQLMQSERSLRAIAALLDGLLPEDPPNRSPSGVGPEGTVQQETLPACEHPGYDADTPPVPGARLGRDPAGNPAWFVPDEGRPGEYRRLQPA